MQKSLQKTKSLVTVALLIALNIIIVRFLSVQTQSIRISFGFLTTSLCSMLFGPIISGVSAFFADFLGMVVNSRGMAYFPGFGINEALYGITYALFLYKRNKSIKNIILCVLTQTIFIDLALGTVWVNMLFNTPIWTILLSRAINSIISFPVKVIGIKFIWKYVGSRYINNNLGAKE